MADAAASRCNALREHTPLFILEERDNRQVRGQKTQHGANNGRDDKDNSLEI